MGVSHKPFIPAMALKKTLKAVVVQEPQKVVRKKKAKKEPAKKEPANQAVHFLNPALTMEKVFKAVVAEAPETVFVEKAKKFVRKMIADKAASKLSWRH